MEDYDQDVSISLQIGITYLSGFPRAYLLPLHWKGNFVSPGIKWVVNKEKTLGSWVYFLSPKEEGE